MKHFLFFLAKRVKQLLKSLFPLLLKPQSNKPKKAIKASEELQHLAETLCTTPMELIFLANNVNSYYKELRIPKKKGGYRVINAPKGRLKEIQKQIHRQLLTILSPSPYATAYQKGNTLSHNALPHVGHRYLLKMDISDFFGNITFKQVLSSAFPSARYSKQCGFILTSLCTKDGILPQGASTSPAISNLVMKSFDEQIGEYCRIRGISYTRYCDDLTFSADFPLFSLSCKTKNMLILLGFEVNTEKTKFISSASRQTVTGLCVNEKVSVPAFYKKQLRQELYYALKFGIENSMIRGKKFRFLRNGIWDVEGYRQHLLGKTNYILQIEPQNGWFLAAKDRLILL